MSHSLPLASLEAHCVCARPAPSSHPHVHPCRPSPSSLPQTSSRSQARSRPRVSLPSHTHTQSCWSLIHTRMTLLRLRILHSIAFAADLRGHAPLLAHFPLSRPLATTFLTSLQSLATARFTGVARFRVSRHGASKSFRSDASLQCGCSASRHAVSHLPPRAQLFAARPAPPPFPPPLSHVRLVVLCAHRWSRPGLTVQTLAMRLSRASCTRVRYLPAIR